MHNQLYFPVCSELLLNTLPDELTCDLVVDRIQQPDAANGTAMCFMKTEKPVSFDPDDPEKDARIFVVLAATDNEVHLSNLMALSETLSDEDIVAKVLAAKTPEDLLQIEA